MRRLGAVHPRDLAAALVPGFPDLDHVARLTRGAFRAAVCCPEQRLCDPAGSVKWRRWSFHRAARALSRRPGLPAGSKTGEMSPYLWALLAMLACPAATFFERLRRRHPRHRRALRAATVRARQRAWGHGGRGRAPHGSVVSFFVLVFADAYGRRLLIT